MKKIYIKDLEQYIGEEIELQAFVDNIRNLQYVQFIILRDGTGKVQLTIEKEDTNNKEMVELVNHLTLESTVKVTGTVSKNEKVKLRGMEMIPSNIVVTSTSKEELPVNIKDKEATLRDTRLDYRFLDLRRSENHLLFSIATTMEKAMCEFFWNHDYIEIHSPKISESNAESGAEQFKLDYFGKQASLVQSPQFYKQMAIASGFDKVFEIGPVFRAENSNTNVHTTEFRGFDVEIGWIDNYHDVMDVEEAWIKSFLKKVKEKYQEQIKEVFHTEIEIDDDIKFPRISFTEVKQIMKDVYHYEAEKEDDLDNQEEKLISKYVKEKYNCDFVFVTNFPYSTRSFYVMKDENGVTQTYDLIYKGVEITSGAQREHRYEILKEQVKEKGIDPKDLEFYLEFFEYGCPPHGGFGVGLERFIMCVLNIDNIREVSYIFRGPTRLNP